MSRLLYFWHTDLACPLIGRRKAPVPSLPSRCVLGNAVRGPRRSNASVRVIGLLPEAVEINFGIAVAERVASIHRLSRSRGPS